MKLAYTILPLLTVAASASASIKLPDKSEIPVLSGAEATLIEVEPNSTIVTAQTYDGSPSVGVFSLAPAGTDIDFFQVSLNAGDFLTGITAPIGNATFTDPDTGIYVVSALTGLVVAADDDGGQGLGSALTYAAPVSGVYFVAVSGFSDLPPGSAVGEPVASLNGLDADGLPHGEAGPYIITLSVVPSVIPEPTTLAAIAGLGVLALRRRK